MCLFRYKKTSVNPYAIIALPKFSAFLGTPFSVDDGIGVAPSCSPAAQDSLASSLGVELPLPLIMQNRSANVSMIVEQPTDLTKLTSRLVSFAERFVSQSSSSPFFVYFAFGHVHTATPNINPFSSPYAGKQYAGCAFNGTSRRGLFGDALAEGERVCMYVCMYVCTYVCMRHC